MLSSLLWTAGAAAAVPVTVEPVRAVVGGSITVSGPPGDVALVPLDARAAPVSLGRLGQGGTLEVEIPNVPRGSYRVVVTGSPEAPVLEVVALGQETSIALVVFGFLFILGLLIAGVVVHRRWRDSIT
ncbi:MAG: hypothetical protein M3R12_10030 [Actinomycetota bacterium]|nr:hypothetical protein [Actinomycetota bacterium]